MAEVPCSGRRQLCSACVGCDPRRTSPRASSAAPAEAGGRADGLSSSGELGRKPRGVPEAPKPPVLGWRLRSSRSPSRHPSTCSTYIAASNQAGLRPALRRPRPRQPYVPYHRPTYASHSSIRHLPSYRVRVARGILLPTRRPPATARTAPVLAASSALDMYPD